MIGGTGRRGRGFTVIEVLIVLAVSMAIFASAILLVNGKQKTTLFSQGINDLQSQLQQITNEVASGYYPDNGDISCSAGGSGLLLTKAAKDQGTNQDCIFLGRALQFAVDNTDPEEYNVYTIVGLRGSVLNPSISLASAKARLVAQSDTEGGSTIPNDEFTTNQLRYGLTVSQAYLAAHPTSSYASVGFAKRLVASGDSDTSEQIDIVPISTAALHESAGTGVGQINARLVSATTVVNPAAGVNICFNSGGTDQSGLVTLGGSGRENVVNLQIFSTKDCQ